MTPDPRRESRRRALRWWPHPVLSALLAVIWLLLQQSLALPQLIVAAVLALVVPRWVRGLLQPAGERARRRAATGSAVAVVRLVGRVLRDIVSANLTVAALVLRPGSRPQPAWVRVPFELDDPLAITLLAAIITTTPGTVSCVIDETRREIIVHALDCHDPVAMAAEIKARYERPLQEILG